MGARSRTKGHAWERECARRLEASTGLPYRRTLTEVREGLQGDVDAPGSPWSLQCKVGARPPVWEALDQAVEASKGDRVPVAILKRNGAGRRPAEEVVVLRFTDFLTLLERLG